MAAAATAIYKTLPATTFGKDCLLFIAVVVSAIVLSAVSSFSQALGESRQILRETTEKTIAIL